MSDQTEKLSETDICIGSYENFHFYRTLDGSPTLAFGQNGEGEKMHHMKGAFSETLHVYGRVLDELKEREWERRILSIGLGIGYNEILVASQFDELTLLVSYEKDRELREYFLNWVDGKTNLVPNRFVKIYEEILTLFSIQFKKEKKKIFWNLLKFRNEGSWKVFHELNESFECNEMSAILFDPYCSKTNMDLWSEDFLEKFLKNVPGSNCIFGTYASTGSLKKVLKNSQFEWIKRKGFKGKRECTFAVKNTAPDKRWFPDLER